MNTLLYDAPAVEWEEALPIGNGRMGAMVFGDLLHERIQLCEESMWVGSPMDRINPDMKANLPKIRALLAAGEVRAAQRLVLDAMTGCPNSMHPSQLLADFWLDFVPVTAWRGIPGEDPNVTDKGGAPKIEESLETLTAETSETNTEASGAAKAEKAPLYRRTLDLDRALTEVVYDQAGTVFSRECFLSYPDDVFAMRLSKAGEKNISFSAHLERGKSFDGVKQFGEDGICLFGNLGRGGVEYAVAFRIQAKGGKVSLLGENVVVEDAKEAEIYLTSATTYHYTPAEKDALLAKIFAEGIELPAYLANLPLSSYEREELRYQAALQKLLQKKMADTLQKAATKGYDALKEAHVADYTSLYGSVQFSLKGAQTDLGAAPTNKRLEDLALGKVACDLGLEKQLFDFGRYLLISCSRPGNLPATLQGVWNKDFTPPWDCKYTININTEMNYWPAEHCNLSACQDPLFDLLEKMLPQGRRVAKEMYGCRGFVAHHNTDLYGDCAPQDVWLPGTYWVMGAAWLCTHIWTRYQYTLDQAFLARMFSLLAESCLFFVDFLIEKDGYLVTSPSVSPENSFCLPNGQKGALCEGPTMDNQILRDLFDACLAAAQILGEAWICENVHLEGVADMPALLSQMAETKARLKLTQIGPDGRIMEWMEAYEELEPGHRHISHLYGLFPSDQINMEKTPALAEAAKKTLQARLSYGGGHTGWSRAWIMNHYAKLWDGEALHENIKAMLTQSTYPNLFDKHPPFQIDGNFGATAAIGHALVQSSLGSVRLLPALPTAWQEGSISGLRLVGNGEISLVWKEGRLISALILAYSDYVAKVKYEDITWDVQLAAGEEVELRIDETTFC